MAGNYRNAPGLPTDSRTLWLKKKYKDSTHAFLQAYIAQQKELTEPYRILALISKFLKGKNVTLNPKDLAKLINDYHDLLLSPPAVSETDEADDDNDGPVLSVEFAKIPRGMSVEDFVDLMENNQE